jgi:hypothetical protein
MAAALRARHAEAHDVTVEVAPGAVAQRDVHAERFAEQCGRVDVAALRQQLELDLVEPAEAGRHLHRCEQQVLRGKRRRERDGGRHATRAC